MLGGVAGRKRRRLPGGGASDNVVVTPANSRLPLDDGFALGVRLDDIKQPTIVVPVETPRHMFSPPSCAGEVRVASARLMPPLSRHARHVRGSERLLAIVQTTNATLRRAIGSSHQN